LGLSRCPTVGRPQSPSKGCRAKNSTAVPSRSMKPSPANRAGSLTGPAGKHLRAVSAPTCAVQPAERCVSNGHPSGWLLLLGEGSPASALRGTVSQHHRDARWNGAALVCQPHHDPTPRRYADARTRQVSTREALRQPSAVCVAVPHVHGDRDAPRGGVPMHHSPRRSM